MNDYYSVLGVHRNAHPTDIRRAYRKLARQLHPDVNPDPQAQVLIRLVNQAYETLGDEKKRREYDYRLDNPATITFESEAPTHRDPHYRRKGNYRPPRARDTTQHDLMKAAFRYLRPVAFAGCFVFIFLLTDYVLPPIKKDETLVRFRSESLGRGFQNYLVTNTGRETKITPEHMHVLTLSTHIIFTETALLGVLTTFQTADGTLSVSNLGTLYNNFIFVPVLLFIGSVLWISAIGSIEFRFNLGLVNTFMLIFTAVLMLIS